jgi:hypothetical protein
MEVHLTINLREPGALVTNLIEKVRRLSGRAMAPGFISRAGR